MPDTLRSRAAYVEGVDDLNVIMHLLRRHGIESVRKDPKGNPPGVPTIDPMGSVEKLLAGMTAAIKGGTDKTIGFVLDADLALASRWAAVRGRLSEAEVDAPEAPPVDGFIGHSPKYRAAVGVWLMPDNQHDGRLETLLRSLIDEADPLIDHATKATHEAKRLGAKFSELDFDKARLHAWLAWQKEPGKPYGTAICAEYFGVDSPAAQQFVAWFKALFAIP